MIAIPSTVVSRPGFSFIIPTYNRAEFLQDTLRTVAAMECPDGVDREVLVIDNNCTDATQDVVEAAAASFPCPLRHILETQQGLCYGRNRGIAEAQFEYLGFLDDDIQVSSRWIAGFLESIDAFGADAVVGPVFPLFTRERPPYLQGKVLNSICSPYSRRGDHVLVLEYEAAHELPGCNFGVKRSAARAVDGFDNTLDRIGDGLLSGGDFDFGRRLREAGKRTVYHPDCWIKHVILPEKLTKPYLRRRAYGTGQTRRMMQSTDVSFWRRSRYLLGLSRTCVESLCWLLLGRTTLSFEKELEAQETWGYVRANAAER